MGFFKTITEGGQIWAHRTRMAKQVLKIAIFTSVFIGVSFFCYRLAQIPKVYYQAFGYHLKAQILSPFHETILVNGRFWGEITKLRTSKETLSVKSETVIRVCDPYISFLGKQITHTVNLSITIGTYAFGVSLVFFLFKGWRSRKKQHIEGKKIVSFRKLALQLIISRRASPIKLGFLPLIKGTETQHILISGATGSGKTNAYHLLLPQIRKQLQRAIIVDTTGEYVEKYYREGKDILLNPFDQRSVSWHPWCECSQVEDYKSMAQSFIPSSYREEENFWRKGAQEVFYAALRECAEVKSTASLSKLLLRDPLTTLTTFLKGTTATAHLDLSSEKTAGSVRAMASTFLECLDLLPDTKTPFSIRDWVHKENSDSWLFLCCTVRQRSSLISLLSAWLSISIFSLLQMPPDINRRLWFVIDELPRLNRLKDLGDFVTESRKFGGCGLLAIQSPAQLDTIYGRDTTSTLLGNCATRIAFAEYDPATALRISKSFGDKETLESHEALSYGAHEMRDGVNLSFQNRTSSVVSPTALQSLNTHEAFVKLPGNLPMTKLKLNYQKMPKIAEAFKENQN